jgi:hypothetical protein
MWHTRHPDLYVAARLMRQALDGKHLT